MSVPGNWIGDLCLAPEAWDLGSTSHCSIFYTPFKTPDAWERVKLHLKLFACSCRKQAWFAVTSKKQDFETTWTMGSIAKNTQWFQPHWHRAKAPRETQLRKKQWSKCHQEPQSQLCPPSPVWRSEDLPLGTLLLPTTMFPPSCYTSSAYLTLCSWNTLTPTMGNSRDCAGCRARGGRGHQDQSHLRHRRKTPQIQPGQLWTCSTWPSIVSEGTRKSSLKRRNEICSTIRTDSTLSAVWAAHIFTLRH